MFEKDIVEGITILNKHDPGWAHRINVDALDMKHCRSDILWLLYKDNEETYNSILEDCGKAETFCGLGIQDAEEADPRWGILTHEWQAIIQRIQQIPEDEPFEAALGSLWEREE